jgi:L-lactate dehydrogenase complex protein LldG
MSTDLVDAFESSLEELDVTHDRTAAADLTAALVDAIVEPAVAAPLPWDDLTLKGVPVDREPTPAALQAAETGVTAAGAGIAEEGSVVVQSRPGGDEPVSLYPPLHVAVLRASDLVADVREAMDWLAGEFAAGRTSAVLATGASATADMGALVHGVHGPGDVHVVTVTDR